MMLLFQHNNLKAKEWVGIRRELSVALRKVDSQRAASGIVEDSVADAIKIQTIQARLFGAALKVVEYYKPGLVSYSGKSNTTAAPGSSASLLASTDNTPQMTHALSHAAHEAVVKARRKHALGPLLSGPVVVLSFPSVSPQHLKAALSIMSPHAPDFPAPLRRTNPGWHDSSVQTGLQKLMLMGARIEGKVFDLAKTRWVGGIPGGLEGERARLVQVLEGGAASLARSLEGVGSNLWLAMEGRRQMLDEADNGGKAGEQEPAKSEA